MYAGDIPLFPFSHRTGHDYVKPQNYRTMIGPCFLKKFLKLCSIIVS